MCVDTLLAERAEPALFWYNPNIHPFTEYRSRKETLVRFAEESGTRSILRDDYGLRSFLAGIGSDFDNRCSWCYASRLEATAAHAAENGYDAFCTSLLISPYQNHERIREEAERAAERFGIAFLYRDFRPFFREGQRRARERGYYMQKYCGCIFSEEERYTI